MAYGQVGRTEDLAVDNIGGKDFLRVKMVTGGEGVIGDPSAGADAFGRLRVSSPYTEFDVTHEFNIQPTVWDDVLVGGASITHLPDESSVRLRCGTASGDKVTRTTHRFFRYQPGKSHLVVMTGVLGDPKANVRGRLGYMDDGDGVFFQQEAAGPSVVVRTSTSGSAVDNQVDQADWNLDTLDGNGPSGITIDFSKTQIFWMDIQWLGVGRVRFGVVVDGDLVYCHQANHANVLTEVYMKTANLPARYELENVGATASNTDLKQICTAVQSEGGIDRIGLPFSGGNGATAVSVNTRRPICSIRPKSTFGGKTNRGLIIPLEFHVLAESQPIFFEVIHQGVLTGASWSSVDDDSVTEVDMSATAITGGKLIHSSYVSAGNGNKGGPSVWDEILSKLPLFADTDILTLVGTSLSGVTDTFGAFNWYENY